MFPIDEAIWTVENDFEIYGSSPNFIHSLDASALVRTVNRCVEQGISQFSMVHDSYGTHSPELPRMQEILRLEFVKMYEEHDVLEELSSMNAYTCLLYTSPSPRDKRQSRMPSSA